MIADPTGLLQPVVAEEIFWGDGGMGQALLGTFLPAAALFGAATKEQIDTWLPAFFGTPGDLAVAALCASEPNAGSDAAALRAVAAASPGAAGGAGCRGGACGAALVVEGGRQSQRVRGEAALSTRAGRGPALLSTGGDSRVRRE
jgi:alkylation response protein AidB-like acyl-CoA dehydrogenase